MLQLLYDTEKVKEHIYVHNCTEGICLQNIFSGLLFFYLYLFKYDTVAPWKNIIYPH